jgi:hypothetical protein
MNKKELNAYLKRTDITLDGNMATWSIAADGDINGTYHGLFRFKCFLTPTEKLAAGREYRELLGENAALAFKNEDNLAFTLAQLKYRIISAPPFWNSAQGINGQLGDIPDENVLDKILEAAMAAELKYFASLKKKKEEMIQKSKAAAEKLLAEQDADDAAFDEEVNESQS